MPFIWPKISPFARGTPIRPEAASCLDAAYILLSGAREGETLSANFHRLLGLPAPVATLDDALAALKGESAVRVRQAVEALYSGQVTAAALLSTHDGARSLACRTYIAPGPREGAGIGIVWLYDVSAEVRQLQRTVQESEKLKSEIKQFSTILNMSPYPIWQRDADLRIRYYNLAYSEMAEAAEGEGDDAPELDRRARALAGAALASGEPKRERRHVVIDGERRLLEISEHPVPQENIVIGFAHDLSEIESLQEELERYVSAQGDLLESSASAMAIYGADMRLSSFNYAFAALWKLDESWLETKPTYGEILESLREKRRLPEQANFVQFKQQQLRLFTDLIEPREEFFYLPDGKALRIIAIPHAMGGILFAYEDVTDRLALERSYNTLIAVQRETLDHLHEAIAVFGEDGRIKLSNPVYLDMWGLDAAYVRAEPHISEVVERVKVLYLPDDWEELRAQAIAQVQRREHSRSRIERTDGKVIDCSTVPLPDGATLITYLDVTDSNLVERSLRERNEALQDADRLKSEFLANVSYELRSPLTSISGFAEMLRQEYFGGLTGKQKEYVEGIHNASQHLMQLVNDILDLASIEAGYMQLEVSRFDVAAMLKSVLPLVQERTREFDIKVKVDCAPKIGRMLGDETRIRQMLFKLLSNAVKFSDPGSTVTLSAAEAQDEGSEWIALVVADEGYGIPPEEQDAIFNKFYKANNPEVPKSRTRSGTGLGLSIVKSFAELHGGRVELASVPGKGTRITCFLPRENEELLPYLKPRRRSSAVAKAAEAG